MTPKHPKPLFIGFDIEKSDSAKDYIMSRIKSFKESKMFSGFKYTFDSSEEGFISYFYKVKVVYPYYASLGGVALILVNLLSIWLLAIRFGGGLGIAVPSAVLIILGLLLVFVDIMFRSAWFFRVMHNGNFKDILKYKGYKKFYKKEFIQEKLREVYDEVKCSA